MRYDLLSDRRRRYLCIHLLTSDEEVYPLDELVDRILERERGRDDTRESDEHRQRIRIGLHHCHLPKLAETGFIDYDARTHTVRYRESLTGDGIRELLDRILPPEEEHLANRD